MIDIWGRPLSALEKHATGTQTTDDVKKIIEDEIAETLNLASVDPGKIVIFGDKQGKLKTSNVSLDDILTRKRDAADDTIALFQDGKLKSGVLMSVITDKFTQYNKEFADHTDRFTQYDKEFADHIKNYNNFRKNIIYKFFGSPMVVTPSLAEIKTGLDKLNELTLFGRQLGTINTDVTAIKDDFSVMKERIEKVKIPHDADKVSNLVYTRQSGPFEWTTTNNMLLINSTVKGIYRLTTI
jgi:hypothetical protein